MDPNFPMNVNSNMDYFYDDNLNLNYPQVQVSHPPQFQYQSQPQISTQPYHHQRQQQQREPIPNLQHQLSYQNQPRPPRPPSLQPFSTTQYPQQQPYVQSLPQSYPQYYQNQTQPSRNDFAQFQQPLYQQPSLNSHTDPRHPQRHTHHSQQIVTPQAQRAPQHIQQHHQPPPPVQVPIQPPVPPPHHKNQPSRSPAQPNSEIVIPTQKHRSPSIQSHSSFQQPIHPQSSTRREREVERQLSSAKQSRPQEPQHSPKLKQEYVIKPQSISSQPLNTTVSLEEIQKKPPRPPLAAISDQTQSATPQSKNGVLQAVVINTTPKQPVMKPPESQPDYLEPEYPTLLCALAEDYLDMARKLPEVTDEYQELVALALGCLESALSNLKLQPLKEAQTSLRYAQVLYEETENYDEAETQLSKAIELCERHKFIDIKYELQLLLSKVLYQSKPKAALRDIQRMIDDIEAYRHTAWLYLFRFQHAMFSLASSSLGDVHSSTSQLSKISNLARQNSDPVMLAFAAVVESLLHLSSSNQEAIVATQTTLAKARALQLNPDVEAIPQMTIIMEFIDLATSIQEGNIVQTEQKRKIVQNVLYEAIGHNNWRDDGFIYLPISKRSLAGVQVSTNGHIFEKNGKHFMGFLWLLKEEAEALGFLFSADSAAHKNGHDGKAEKYAKTGLALVRGWQRPGIAENYEQSDRAFIGNNLLEAQFLFLIAFMQCSMGKWERAERVIAELSRISESLGVNFPSSMVSGMLYLRGVILQGMGDTTAALTVYQSDTLRLVLQHTTPTQGLKTHQKISHAYYTDSDATKNFRLLAAMNSAFIIQNPQHPQHHQLSVLLSNIRPVAENSANKYIQAHYSLMKSILSTTTLTVKQFLKSAMDAGKATGSTMTTALALIYMQQKMFRGTVDEQALKCAKAASHQTRRWGEPMWIHVAAGLEAEALEINGFPAEAAKKETEAESLWDELPERVKNGG
ncbi:hypothetical protein LTR84_007996 [Exophiala bonariae]|uniref:Uncharacterized protein n=1 Tax=Exophiala bonariae TaxID=1690606 RepID=A0AAV9NMN9_9EURO|nr:hypothetical protein LTR84_007996 [Exophiala bonariae]